MKRFDVLVIGAGVGGACAAIAAARRGLSVLLVEAGAMPRHKVCGEFLSPEIQNVFARIGALERVVAAGARPVTEANVYAGARCMGVTPFSRPGLALSRRELDLVLWRVAADSGVRRLEKTSISRFDKEGESGYTAIDSDGNEYLADYLIAAPGRNSRLVNDAAKSPGPKRYLGIKAHFRGARLPAGLVELHALAGGYCGLLLVEANLVNACLLVSYSAAAAASPELIWQRCLDSCPALRARMGDAVPAYPWLTTANLSFGQQHPTSGGVLLCGDAGGYIHPFSGDGMAMASRSGELAAATITAAVRGGLARRDVAPLYAGAWRREFETRLSWASRIQPLICRPTVAVPLTAALSHLPAARLRLVKATRGRA